MKLSAESGAKPQLMEAVAGTSRGSFSIHAGGSKSSAEDSSRRLTAPGWRSTAAAYQRGGPKSAARTSASVREAFYRELASPLQGRAG
jgi:hypothetical protein